MDSRTGKDYAILSRWPRAALIFIIISTLTVCVLLSGCSGSSSAGASSGSSGSSSETPRKTRSRCAIPEASGAKTAKSANGLISIDFSNTEDGYVMVKYTGKKNVQVQITNPDGSVYPYPLTHGRFVAFPFTRGDGKYTIKVLEQMSGSDYALALSKHFSVELENKLSPFLYPNQYVQYTNSSSAVKLGRRLSEKSDTDLGYVESVYDYIINNVAYDKELAEDTPTNYVPDIDKTLRTKKGICFDYAALMTAMLRSQGIPTKLEVGYAGDVYHA
ncbi:MAG: transglutaminase-like domain-containing protein [Anaerovoracaceae bacterium]